MRSGMPAVMVMPAAMELAMVSVHYSHGQLHGSMASSRASMGHGAGHGGRLARLEAMDPDHSMYHNKLKTVISPTCSVRLLLQNL